VAVTEGRGVTFARGFVAGAVAAGVKHAGTTRLDVALIASTADHCHAAAVFTTNQVIAAPCVVTRKHVGKGHLRGIVVNSGNANACTGPQGERDAIAMADAAAAALGVDPYRIAVANIALSAARRTVVALATSGANVVDTSASTNAIATIAGRPNAS